jgi:hypothetical protein
MLAAGLESIPPLMVAKIRFVARPKRKRAGDPPKQRRIGQGNPWRGCRHRGLTHSLPAAVSLDMFTGARLLSYAVILPRELIRRRHQLNARLVHEPFPFRR